MGGDQPALHLRDEVRLRPGGGGRAGAVVAAVVGAVPLVVADVQELQLEGAEAEPAQPVQLGDQRVHVLAGGVAERLPGVDRVAEHDVVGPGPLGEPAQPVQLRRRVGLAPAAGAVRVRPGRVQEEVLLRPGEEVQLVEAFLGGPRGAVEGLGGAAHRGAARPVAQHDPGQALAGGGRALALAGRQRGEELAQALRGVEGAGAVDAGQHHRAVAAAAGGGELSGGQYVAAGGQSDRGEVAGRASGGLGQPAQRPVGVAAGALRGPADVHHERAGGRGRGAVGLDDVGGAGRAEHLPDGGQRGPVGVGGGDQGDGVGDGHRGARGGQLLRAGVDLGFGERAERGDRGAADGAVGDARGGRPGRRSGQQAAHDSGGRERRGELQGAAAAAGAAALRADGGEQRFGALEVGDEPVGGARGQLAGRTGGRPAGRQRRRVLQELTQGRVLSELLPQAPSRGHRHPCLHRTSSIAENPAAHRPLTPVHRLHPLRRASPPGTRAGVNGGDRYARYVEKVCEAARYADRAPGTAPRCRAPPARGGSRGRPDRSWNGPPVRRPGRRGRQPARRLFRWGRRGRTSASSAPTAGVCGRRGRCAPNTAWAVVRRSRVQAVAVPLAVGQRDVHLLRPVRVVGWKGQQVQGACSGEGHGQGQAQSLGRVSANPYRGRGRKEGSREQPQPGR
ncbi:hypothetical protein GCM10025734_58930 [Kitasatospora paranensis]